MAWILGELILPHLNQEDALNSASQVGLTGQLVPAAADLDDLHRRLLPRQPRFRRYGRVHAGARQAPSLEPIMLSTPALLMPNPQQTQSDPSLRVEELLQMVRQQAKAIESLKTGLSKQITTQIANSTKQIEAHQALQALVGDVAAPLHGWPISPDFALQLVRLIRDNDYHLIVEFGSGTSTLLSLRTIERFGLHSASLGPTPHRLLTFEHLDIYHQKTTDLVSACSNRALLDLRLSPLEPWEDATGSYSYYSGITVIAEAIQALSLAFQGALKLLVVIDGPPGATCHWARYPAIPIVLDAASGMNLSIDFLLDDMIRPDEKEMALAWENQLQVFGLPCQRVEYNFEKGGLLLATENLSGVDTTIARAEEFNFLQRIAGLEEESSRLEAIFRAW